ncbi:MAG: phosphatidate cytidylyltransferase [Propionibacteriaceae bacterium]
MVDPLPAANTHGRAGRDLPAAIGVGVALGAAVVLSLLFFEPGFVIVITALLVLASIELVRALARQGLNASMVPVVAGTVVISSIAYVTGLIDPDANAGNAMLGALGIAVVTCLIWRMPKGQDHFVRDVASSLMIIGYVPLLGSFTSLLITGERGEARIVTFILIVILSDIGGYVAGVLFGKHPMAPRISPKKSWEGFVGSLVFGIAGGVVMAVVGLKVPFWVGIVLGVALVVVGVCGDLVESLVKRDIGIKDMSSFLPGHGGVMDRLDSLLMAAPLAWLLMYLMVPGG